MGPADLLSGPSPLQVLCVNTENYYDHEHTRCGGQCQRYAIAWSTPLNTQATLTRELDAGCDVSTDQRAGRCQSDLCAYCRVASQEESITRATNLAGVLSQIYSSRTLLYNIRSVREPTSSIQIKVCTEKRKRKNKLYKVQPF